jgi:hypothetical protein
MILGMKIRTSALLATPAVGGFLIFYVLHNWARPRTTLATLLVLVFLYAVLAAASVYSILQLRKSLGVWHVRLSFAINALWMLFALLLIAFAVFWIAAVIFGAELAQ